MRFSLTKPKTAIAATAIAAAMFGFGYAMVPLYYRLCAALGIDVATVEVYKEVTRGEAAVRPLRMEFDANSHNDLVAMSPDLRTTRLDTGTAYKVAYEISNLTDRHVTGTAVPSYSPQRAGKWVRKLHCFCFEEVDLMPNEARVDPVVFIVDRDIPADIEVVSLSYTFFPKEGADGHTAH